MEAKIGWLTGSSRWFLFKDFLENYGNSRPRKLGEDSYLKLEDVEFFASKSTSKIHCRVPNPIDPYTGLVFLPRFTIKINQSICKYSSPMDPSWEVSMIFSKECTRFLPPSGSHRSLKEFLERKIWSNFVPAMGSSRVTKSGCVQAPPV